MLRTSPCSSRGCTCACAPFAELARFDGLKPVPHIGISNAIPNGEQKGELSMNALRMRVAVLVLLVGAGIADAQTKIKAGFNLFSAQDDVQVGQQSAVEAERQLPMLRDATVQQYVDRIGQRLAANAGGAQFQYKVRVVNAADINAFSLPRGAG